jgi:hypothetical protein
MKRHYLLLVSLFSCLGTFAQVNGDYRTRAAGALNWNGTTTWQKYVSGVWTNVTSNPTSADGTITIQSGHTITVIGGVTVDQLVIDGSLTLAATFVIANGAGTDIQINSTGSVTVNATKTMTINGIALNSGSITNNGTLNINSGTTYQHYFTSSNGTIPTATWNAASTCEILACNGTSAPAGLNQAFGNFIWNNASQSAPLSLASSTVAFGVSILGVGNPAIAGDLWIKNTNGYNLILKSFSAVSFTCNGIRRFADSKGRILPNGRNSGSKLFNQYFR